VTPSLFVTGALGAWLQAHHQKLFRPAIAIAEMAQGIANCAEPVSPMAVVEVNGL
jgi:hypothetical protein